MILLRTCSAKILLTARAAVVVACGCGVIVVVACGSGFIIVVASGSGVVAAVACGSGVVTAVAFGSGVVACGSGGVVAVPSSDFSFDDFGSNEGAKLPQCCPVALVVVVPSQVGLRLVTLEAPVAHLVAFPFFPPNRIIHH